MILISGCSVIRATSPCKSGWLLVAESDRKATEIIFVSVLLSFDSPSLLSCSQDRGLASWKQDFELALETS